MNDLDLTSEPRLRALAESLPHDLRVAAEVVALNEWRVRTSSRMGFTHDGARNVYSVLGYDQYISTEQFCDLYRRGGIAGRALDAIPKAVWRGDGELVEDLDVKTTTPFEQTFYDMNDRLKVWSTLLRCHILALRNSYSVMLLGVEGGDLSLPLPRARNGVASLVYLRPYGGSAYDEKLTQATNGTGNLVTVAEWDEDNASPRYGQPKTYYLRSLKDGTKTSSKPVHYTRVVHFPAEGFLDDAVFGPPALEGCWNNFVDLYKCVGGGAETSWLAGNPGMQMDVDPNATWPGATVKEQQENADKGLAEMRAKAEDYRHQLTRWLFTKNVKVTTLQGKTVDFSANASTLIQLIAGTRGIPVRILIGSERGQLASTQDRDNFADVVNDCRTSYAHPIMLRPFIERLIEYGYMPKPAQWEPAWPETGGMSEAEKLGAAAVMVGLNDHGTTVVTGNEVREYLGKEPLKPADVQAEKEANAPLAPSAPPAPPPQDPNADPNAPGGITAALGADEQVEALEELLRRDGGKLVLSIGNHAA